MTHTLKYVVIFTHHQVHAESSCSLISACFLLSEMTDEGLAMLKICCSDSVLRTLDLLVSKDQIYEERPRKILFPALFP